MIPIFDLHNFCEGLPADVQREIDKVSKYRTIEAGAAIVRVGDTRHFIHQLVEGHVIYCSCDSRGRETVTAVMKPGDWIGLSEVFTDGPAMADVVAATAVQLRTIARRDFEGLLDAHPVIARHLLKLFSLRFGIVYRLAQDQRELTLKERLLKMLYLLAFRQGQSGPAAAIDMSQDELAKVLAASRQTLNRLLKELEHEGLLTLGYRSIRMAARHKIERSYRYLLATEPA
jgi:CRP/FNR family transcriptional regulator, cyclic AMP receptor protein